MDDQTKIENFKREKAKARKLRKSQWWQRRIQEGICHYCGGKFDPAELTMDHIVPIARGGKSSKGNTVPACKQCNTHKRYYTAAEVIMREKWGDDIVF